MNTYSSPIRVGVAGATGYAGQELLGLLARHPAGPARGGDVLERRFGCPAVAASCAVWNGAGRAARSRSARRGARTSSFLAVPENAAADLAPPLVVGRRSRDRSVRCVSHPRRCGAIAVVSGDEVAPGRRGVRPDGALQDPTCAMPRSWPIRAAIRRPRCSRCCRWRGPGLLDASAGVVIDAKSGISGAGRAPSDRTHFSENHGSVAAYGVFDHRHVAEMEQELGASVDVRAASGAARPRHPRDDLREGAGRASRTSRSPMCSRRRTRTSRSSGSPATRCRRSSTSRGRTSATSAGASTPRSRPARDRRVSGQPRERRGGPGAAELQRRLRLRRTDGAAVNDAAGAQARRRAARDRRPARADGGADRLARLAAAARASCTAADGRSTRSSIAAASRRRRSTACAITDEPTLDVVVSVLAGSTNTALVAALVGLACRRSA